MQDFNKGCKSNYRISGIAPERINKNRIRCSTATRPIRRFVGSSKNYYSVLKLFTGFAMAALIALMLTVINAIPKVISAAKTKTHQLKLVL